MALNTLCKIDTERKIITVSIDSKGLEQKLYYPLGKMTNEEAEQFAQEKYELISKTPMLLPFNGDTSADNK